MKIGVMFGNPETTTGGFALKFYSSIRLEVRKVETICAGQRRGGRQQGPGQGGQEQDRSAVPQGGDGHHVRQGHLGQRQPPRRGRAERTSSRRRAAGTPTARNGSGRAWRTPGCSSRPTTAMAGDREEGPRDPVPEAGERTVAAGTDGPARQAIDPSRGSRAPRRQRPPAQGRPPLPARSRPPQGTRRRPMAPRRRKEGALLGRRAQTTVFLALGSNLGDREATLRGRVAGGEPSAGEMRGSHASTRPSRMYVTDQPGFLNAAGAGETTLAPLDASRGAERDRAGPGTGPSPRGPHGAADDRHRHPAVRRPRAGRAIGCAFRTRAWPSAASCWCRCWSSRRTSRDPRTGRRWAQLLPSVAGQAVVLHTGR